MAKKIIVNEYLNYIYKGLEEFNAFKLTRDKVIREKLTCKKLAELVGVTPATLSNLNTDSKFSLVRSVASEIHSYYWPYFDALTRESMAHPCDDGSFSNYDEFYILEMLVDCFNENMV